MNDAIVLNSEGKIDCDGRIPITYTNNGAYQLADYKYSLSHVESLLNMKNILLITGSPKNGGNDYYLYILLEDIVLVCSVIKEEGKLLLIAVNKKNNNNIKTFMNKSIRLYSKSGVVFYKDYGYKATTINGEEININSDREYFKNTIGLIIDKIRPVNNRNKEGFEGNENDEVNEKFQNMLNTVSSYNIIEDRIQKELIHEKGAISYSKFEAVLMIERIDNVQYKFIVDNSNLEIFKVGTLVSVEININYMLDGIVIESNNEGESFLIISFNEEFNVGILKESGIILLKYSETQKNVREAVVEQLSKGTAKAQYLDDVLGNGDCRGFKDIDVSELLEKLKNQDMPPNDSQLLAIEKGIKTKDMLLVLGPPGTGKTTVILEWVKYFVKKENKKVLVSSQANE